MLTEGNNCNEMPRYLTIMSTLMTFKAFTIIGQSQFLKLIVDEYGIFLPDDLYVQINANKRGNVHANGCSLY